MLRRQSKYRNIFFIVILSITIILKIIYYLIYQPRLDIIKICEFVINKIDAYILYKSLPSSSVKSYTMILFFNKIILNIIFTFLKLIKIVFLKLIKYLNDYKVNKYVNMIHSHQIFIWCILKLKLIIDNLDYIIKNWDLCKSQFLMYLKINYINIYDLYNTLVKDLKFWQDWYWFYIYNNVTSYIINYILQNKMKVIIHIILFIVWISPIFFTIKIILFLYKRIILYIFLILNIFFVDLCLNYLSDKWFKHIKYIYFAIYFNCYYALYAFWYETIPAKIYRLLRYYSLTNIVDRVATRLFYVKLWLYGLDERLDIFLINKYRRTKLKLIIFDYHFRRLLDFIETLPRRTYYYCKYCIKFFIFIIIKVRLKNFLRFSWRKLKRDLKWLVRLLRRKLRRLIKILRFTWRDLFLITFPILYINFKLAKQYWQAYLPLYYDWRIKKNFFIKQQLIKKSRFLLFKYFPRWRLTNYLWYKIAFIELAKAFISYQFSFFFSFFSTNLVEGHLEVLSVYIHLYYFVRRIKLIAIGFKVRIIYIKILICTKLKWYLLNIISFIAYIQNFIIHKILNNWDILLISLQKIFIIINMYLYNKDFKTIHRLKYLWFWISVSPKYKKLINFFANLMIPIKYYPFKNTKTWSWVSKLKTSIAIFTVEIDYKTYIDVYNLYANIKPHSLRQKIILWNISIIIVYLYDLFKLYLGLYLYYKLIVYSLYLIYWFIICIF